MRTGHIQGTHGGIELSKVILGCGSFGSSISRDLSFQMMDRYYEVEGRCFDTGRAYEGWIHNGASKSEYTLGKWIKSRGVRSNVKIITKGAHPEIRDMRENYRSRLSPDCLEYDMNTSLAVLDEEYVDVYFLHRDDEHIPVGEIMDVLDTFVKEGLTHAIGASNWTVSRILEANAYARKNHKTPFTVSQVMWNMAYMTKEKMFDPTCLFMSDSQYAQYLDADIPVIAYSAQAGGFFSKYLAAGRGVFEGRGNLFLNDVNIQRANRVEQICQKYNCSPAALSIAFVTNNKLPGYALIGNSSMKQMEDSITGFDLVIGQEDIDYILGG